MPDAVMSKLRLLHRWIGLTLAVPLLIQGVTGCVLAVTPPFEAWRLPQPQQADGAPHAIGAIIAAAQSAASAGLVPLRYQAGPTAQSAATIDLARPSQRMAEARVFVDPVSLAILGQRDRPERFYRWVHSLHETLLIPGALGHSVIGWSGLGLFSLGLSGIPIWWPRRGRWKAALGVPRSASGYRLQRALHGAAGGWLVALLLLQSLSGASMAFPRTFSSILGVAPPRMPTLARTDARAGGSHGVDAHASGSRGAGEAAPGAQTIRADATGTDAVVAAVRAAAPDATLTTLRFPTEADRPVIAMLLPADEAQGAPPVVVFVDPTNPRVVATRDPRTGPLGAELLAWLRALHSGGGLGPVWRVVVCLLGLTLPLFPITGVAMWLLRHRDRSRRKVSRAILQGANE